MSPLAVYTAELPWMPQMPAPGCDKTLATCQSKFGYVPANGTSPFFRGNSFIPDPTTMY